MEKQYLKIGYVIATHGLRGALKIKPATTFVDERFKSGKKLYIENPVTKKIEKLTIKTVTPQKDILVIVFKEFTDINDAELYLKKTLLIDKENITLDEGYFYLDDLLGMNVVLEDNKVVGVVSEILEYASYYTLRIKRDNEKDLLVPYIEEFIISTDLPSKTIVFRPIEGML